MKDLDPDTTYKNCSDCNTKKLLKEFYRAGKRNGKVQYQHICKECDKERKRKDYHTGRKNEWIYKKQYIRARSRALNRLSKLVPELYDKVLREELVKEGVPLRKGRYDGNAYKSVTINTDGTPKSK